jgi:hypothetical protein
VTLIGVKSKYGSGWGTSPGIINITIHPNKTQKNPKTKNKNTHKKTHKKQKPKNKNPKTNQKQKKKQILGNFF